MEELRNCLMCIGGATVFIVLIFILYGIYYTICEYVSDLKYKHRRERK